MKYVMRMRDEGRLVEDYVWECFMLCVHLIIITHKTTLSY